MLKEYAIGTSYKGLSYLFLIYLNPHITGLHNYKYVSVNYVKTEIDISMFKIPFNNY